jgi:hypothetical protein
MGMRYKTVEGLREHEFYRLTGVRRKTFEQIVEILEIAERKKKAAGGKPNKLSMSDRLLMLLEYYREYRTYFHISKGYGISESACFRNIRWMEEVLVKDKSFALPGRKALLQDKNKHEVVAIDASETPIQRPKKSKDSSTLVRKNATHLKHK